MGGCRAAYAVAVDRAPSTEPAIPTARRRPRVPMQTLQGIAVSSGIAIGEALVINDEGYHIARRLIPRDSVERELGQFRRALEQVANQIEGNRLQVDRELGEQYAAIFTAHLQLLRDPRLSDEIEAYIRERHYAPEYAVSTTLRRYVRLIQQMNNAYLAERANDLVDLDKALLDALRGARHHGLADLASPVIVFAHNLTPSETASLHRQFVLGFVTEVGGAGGHTAIVAKALEIPAIVGAGRFPSEVNGGGLVIIDGDEGLVILAPDEDTLQQYRQRGDARRSRAQRLTADCDLPAQTTDGARIAVQANIEFPEEAAICLERGAEGIGLYRTEFLYLGAGSEPTEDEHYAAYANVARTMGSRPVTIRTFDLGADKLGTGFEEKNPFLGLRSIRLSLRRLPLFRTQLRAILRASVEGNVRVMFPLVSTLNELRQAKRLLADTMEDLEEEGLPFNRHIPIGMMVETPAAVVTLASFLPEVDFISIGTNDLIQYALAVDRTNPEVGDLYSASEPAVLKLIEHSVNAARARDVPVGLCGQMSGSAMYVMLLIGLGLRSLSVPPSAVPEIKTVCRGVSASHCENIARRALALDGAREVDAFLREELRKALPELASA